MSRLRFIGTFGERESAHFIEKHSLQRVLYSRIKSDILTLQLDITNQK